MARKPSSPEPPQQTALVHQQPEKVYEFFDPNVGEFRFVRSLKTLVTFLSELWEAVYDDLPTAIPHQVWYKT